MAPQTCSLAASISFLEKPRCAQQVEAGLVQLLGRDLQRVGEELLAERPLVEDELDVEGGFERALDLAQRPRR